MEYRHSVSLLALISLFTVMPGGRCQVIHLPHARHLHHSKCHINSLVQELNQSRTMRNCKVHDGPLNVSKWREQNINKSSRESLKL